MQVSPHSFGKRPFAIERQGAPGGLYAENTRWKYGDIVFVGLNVPGSNNNRVKAGECVSAKARAPRSSAMPTTPSTVPGMPRTSSS